MTDCLHLLYLGMYEAAERALLLRDVPALSLLEVESGRQEPAVCRASMLALGDALLHLPARGRAHLARQLGAPCCDRHGAGAATCSALAGPAARPGEAARAAPRA